MPRVRYIENVTHICDDCKFAVWHDYFENRDLKGNPITFECGAKSIIGNFVRGHSACSLWRK